MAKQGKRKNWEKVVKHPTERTIIYAILGMLVGWMVFKMPFQLETKLIIVVLIGLSIILLLIGYTIWIRRRIKKTEVKMAEINMRMIEINERRAGLEVETAKSLKIITLLKKLPYPFGLDKYRWN